MNFPLLQQTQNSVTHQPTTSLITLTLNWELTWTWTNVNCGILTATIIPAPNWQLLTSHIQVFFIYGPPMAVSHWELTENSLRTDWTIFSLSYKFLIWHVEKQSFCTVADVTHWGCVTSLRKAEVTWPLLTVAWSKHLQLLLNNGEHVYTSTA
jgi:hypothetical protein